MGGRFGTFLSPQEISGYRQPRRQIAMARKPGAKARKNESAEEFQENPAMRRKADMIKQTLERIYPVPPKGFLNHSDPFTLLVAVLLSAQCLDRTVNATTPELFRVAGTPESMRALGEDKIKELIKKIGLYNAKAKALAGLSAEICDKHDGNVPQTMGELEKLPGVGHKTASVVMMQAFNKPAFPVDTHIHRLACRWGCGVASSVPHTEAALKKWFPDPNSWGDLHVRIILFGREHCPARKHDMDTCPICSFAATSEARSLNKSFPLKFVAARSHKDPYSIRNIKPGVGKDKPENGPEATSEETASPDKGSMASSTKRQRRKAVKKEDRDDANSKGARSDKTAPKLAKAERKTVKVETKDDDSEEEGAQSKSGASAVVATRRGRRMQGANAGEADTGIAKKRSAGASDEDAPRQKKGRVARSGVKRTPANSESSVVGPRRSTRLRR